MGMDGETARLKALHGYGVLDTPNEAEFDAIVREAAKALGTPVALISLIDEHRQWFKAKVGLEPAETPRSISFCTHAIRGTEVMVVEDARNDARFADNPLVTGDPNIRFYAGAPLKTRDGQRIGTLCVIDTAVHGPPSAADRTKLEALAARTVQAFERRAARRSALERLGFE
jgi:GAF domain-containing protein